MAIPRTLVQSVYLKTLRNARKPITIATGPAGTGKTLFACQVAAEKLYKNHIKKLILTRPIISVDEELGYLPGKLEDKMDPYMRPLTDILSEYFSRQKIQQLIKNKSIEIAPLAFMRGRTFDNAFIIGDEVQNTTVNQMKMLLTRIGENSQMVITGDLEQCDLHDDRNSGLIDLITRADIVNLEYIEHVILTTDDIQRHPAVKEVLKLYE
jgi:phosphate starvation-inducible PhoH-like protein